MSRSDLSPDAVREALEYWSHPIGLDADDEKVEPVHLGPVFEAARLWLASRSGPSDQEIKAAAQVLADNDGIDVLRWHKELARRILVAARQGVDSE